jgi:hypothetical protein
MNLENIDLKEALAFAEQGWREAILYAREQKEKSNEKDIQLKILTNEIQLLQRQLLLRIHCEKEVQENISNSIELLSITSNNLILATKGEQIKDIQSPTNSVKIEESKQFIVGHNDLIEKKALFSHSDSLNNINKRIKRSIDWIIKRNELEADRDKIIDSPTTRLDNEETQTTISLRKSDISIASPITLIKNELLDSNQDEFNNNNNEIESHNVLINNVINSLKENKNIQIKSPLQSFSKSNPNIININLSKPVVIKKNLSSSSENNIIKKSKNQNDPLILQSTKISSLINRKAAIPIQNKRSDIKPGLTSNNNKKKKKNIYTI